MAAMPHNLDLRVVTPERELVRESVEEVQVPARGGYLGVLPGHTPLLSELQFGALSYRIGAEWTFLTVFGGFVEVQADRVIVLAQASELSGEIDVERARQARSRAEDRLKHAGDPDVDLMRAKAALERALLRLEVAVKTKNRV